MIIRKYLLDKHFQTGHKGTNHTRRKKELLVCKRHYDEKLKGKL